jgi:signal peptidase I
MYSLGYISEPINISGTGSMYPTFPKGEGKDPKELSRQLVSSSGMLRYPNGITLFGKRYFNHILGHGDIVVVDNQKIRELTKKTYDKESGLVKRVIAIPNDTIQIRDGNVYLNGEILKEPYIARARSTFGGSTLADCTPLTIPPHKYFLMGDNRKGSSDSRDEVGLVDESDIQFALPYKNQIGSLDKHWHDPTNDSSDTSKITLDTNEFFQLVNEKRKELGSPALVYEEKLSRSSKKRGETILKYNDFSFEATRSGYSMKKAVADTGYSNIIYAEWPIQGYYEASELVDNLFAFSKGREFLTNKQYDDVGVAEVQGSIASCPTHLVVLEFGGYVPPNYTSDIINSWKNALENLQNIKSGWNNLKSSGSFYNEHQSEINRLNDIIAIRISNITGIVSRMEKNQWLTDDQETFVKQDVALQNELNDIARRLNSYRN